MDQRMEAMQTMARGQEEIRQANLRANAANHVVTMPVSPLGGNGTLVVTQPPLEGDPVN